MNISRSIIAVDSHTMGEPTRVVTAGLPNIPGKSISEKKQFLENNYNSYPILLSGYYLNREYKAHRCISLYPSVHRDPVRNR